MILPLCPICRQPADWDVNRVGAEVQLSVKCYVCNPAGPWEPELVDIIRKPRGRAGLWPAAPDAPPLAPCDRDPN